MSLEQGKIGNSQLIILMVGFIFGASIVLVPGREAAHDAWMAIILGMLEGSFFALIYTILSNRFKGKSLIQIHEIVYGKYLGKLISLVFLWYLFHLGSLDITTFKDFFLVTTLPQTPELIIAAFIVLSCCYAVKNGIEVIARCAQILVLAAIGSSFISSLLILKDIDLKNLLPIMETPLKKLFMAAHGTATFPFGDTIVFMMIFPYLNDNRDSHRHLIFPVIISFLIGGLFLTIVSIRNIGVLGPMNEINFYPTFQTDRLINVGNLLTRLEILTVIGFLTMGFVKISVLLYATVLGGSQLFGLRTYRPLILPIGILMVIASLINFKNVTGNLAFAQQIYPIYALPFQVGIPLLTLIIGLIRKLPQNQKI
jgi:spore germination protein KB